MLLALRPPRAQHTKHLVHMVWEPSRSYAVGTRETTERRLPAAQEHGPQARREVTLSAAAQPPAWALLPEPSYCVSRRAVPLSGCLS